MADGNHLNPQANVAASKTLPLGTTAKVINLQNGKSATVNVNGVHFTGLTVQGKPVTSQTDTDASWNINQFVSNITFQ